MDLRPDLLLPAFDSGMFERATGCHVKERFRPRRTLWRQVVVGEVLRELRSPSGQLVTVAVPLVRFEPDGCELEARPRCKPVFRRSREATRGR